MLFCSSKTVIVVSGKEFIIAKGSNERSDTYKLSRIHYGLRVNEKKRKEKISGEGLAGTVKSI